MSPGDGSRTLRFRRRQWPERRRSGATVLVVKGALYIFLALHLLRLPRRPMLQHGVKNSQQLMHARRQGDFFDFPRREEPFVKDFDLRVEARGHQRAHVEHRAHMRAPAPDHAPPAEGPTVTM